MKMLRKQCQIQQNTRLQIDDCTHNKGETADFVLPGFLGFLWYSRDFHGTPGIFGIFMVLPGFAWDSRDFHGILGIFMGFPWDFRDFHGISIGFSGFSWDFQDFHRTPNPYLYYILYLSSFIEDVQNIFATLLCAVSTVCLVVYSKKIRVYLFNTEKSTLKNTNFFKIIKIDIYASYLTNVDHFPHIYVVF
jgi:hypothetical protein